MSFKDSLRSDNTAVFTNIAEFAIPTSIRYEGRLYEDVPCVLTKVKAKDRQAPASDHAQGIYLVSSNAYFPVESLDGIVPEKGTRIELSDETGFMRQFYVAQASCPEGMVHLELEGLDE